MAGCSGLAVESPPAGTDGGGGTSPPPIDPAKITANATSCAGSASCRLSSRESSLSGGRAAEGRGGSGGGESGSDGESSGLERALDAGLKRGRRSAGSLHDCASYERNGEIKEDRDDGGKRHDEREEQPVLHDDGVLRSLNDSAGRDWREEQVADGGNDEVDQTNRDVPEQDGERRDAELDAERLGRREEQKSNQERRNRNQSGNGEFLKKPQHNQHEASDALEEIPDGRRDDLPKIGEGVRGLVLDAGPENLDKLGIPGVGELAADFDERRLSAFHNGWIAREQSDN